ncbi:hypothetical protein ES703_99159 [subsurface metagenome]
MVAGQLTFESMLKQSVRDPGVCDSVVPDRNLRRLARTSDPSTSHAAARGVCRSGRLGRQEKAVYEALCQHSGSTSAELAQLMSGDRYTPSRRLSGLERKNLVLRGRARKCSATGSMCLTWWVRENGDNG